MPLTLATVNVAALIAQLCPIIARFGLARGLAGPVIIAIWQRVRTAGTHIELMLARHAAGTLRRHPRRRLRIACKRRQVLPGKWPRKRAWLVTLIPETAGNASQLQLMLANPNVPAMLAAAPQLRRSLRPLCHMLGVSLPKPPPVPQPPTQPPPQLPPQLPEPEPPSAPYPPSPAAARESPAPMIVRTERPPAKARGPDGFPRPAGRAMLAA